MDCEPQNLCFVFRSVAVAVPPQIDGIQLKKILGLVKSGQEQGASLQFGGAQFGDKGYFMQPTVFGDVGDGMDISKEEVSISRLSSRAKH